MDDSVNAEPTALLQQAQQLLEDDQLVKAGEILESIAFEHAAPEEELIGRTMALLVAVWEERWIDGMRHGDALLEAGVQDPAVYHLTGRALWECGSERGAAETLVKAAELMRDFGDDLSEEELLVDPVAIHFLAGEACAWFEQYESALEFYTYARELAPEDETIEQAIAEVNERY
jgi:tetratricopeptide (TPR) repeat protein